MKTNEIEAGSVYAISDRLSSLPMPGRVVEARLWTRRYSRHGQPDIVRSEKGERAGRDGYGGQIGKMVGIPTLVIGAPWDNWTMGNRNESGRILTSPEVILNAAYKFMNVLGYVDHTDGASQVSCQVPVETETGEARRVTVALKFCQPRAILKDWDSFFSEQEAERVEQAELRRAHDTRVAEAQETAQQVALRVDKLLGDSSKSFTGERYDVCLKRTSSGLSSTYEIETDTLLKLLDLAEKGNQA